MNQRFDRWFAVFVQKSVRMAIASVIACLAFGLHAADDVKAGAPRYKLEPG